MEEINQVIFIVTVCLLVVALVVTTINYVYFYKKQHFVCPHCGLYFKPKVVKMIFSTNAVEGKIMNCPGCGSKEYFEPVKDNGMNGFIKRFK